MNSIIRDNGYRSRKLWFSVFAVAVMCGTAALAAHVPAIAPLYDTLVGGIVAVSALFLTGQVATKWVGTKIPMEPPISEAPAEESPAPKSE